MTIPEAMYEALDTDDFVEFKRLMLAHPEELRNERGKCIWLYNAASLGKLEAVKFLAALGVDVNEARDATGDRAIVRAAGNGHLEVVRWLLDHGADVNRVDRDGTKWCSALTMAAFSGHFDVVKLLVERGADVNALGPGMTPLSYALMYGQTAIADYLRSVGAKLPWQVAPRNLPAGHAAILAHFKKHRGKPAPLALQEIVPGDPPIAVHVVPPSKKWDGQTLFTVGMSDRPLRLPDGSEGFAELTIALPKNWPLTNQALRDPNWSWPLLWLRRIALYPHETGSWPGGDSLVFANEEPPQPFAPNTKLSCFLAIAEPGEFGSLTLPDHRPIAIYSLYAIYTEERDLEKWEGTRRLIELFEKHHVLRTVDIARPNVALRETPKRR